MRKAKVELNTTQIKDIQDLFNLGCRKYFIGKFSRIVYGTHLSTPYRHLNSDPKLYKFHYTSYQDAKNRQTLKERVRDLRGKGLNSGEIAKETGKTLKTINKIIVSII